MRKRNKLSKSENVEEGREERREKGKVMQQSCLRVIGMWRFLSSGGFKRVREKKRVCVCVCVKKETYECVKTGVTEESSHRINYPIKITSQRKTLGRSSYN